MQKLNFKIKYAFCFVIDHSDPEIEASCNYLTWLFNTIFRIPIETVTENEFVDLICYDKVQNCINYSAIFLLSIINGKNPRNHHFWLKIKELNQKIPILTFYRGAKIISGNEIGRDLFNIKFIKEKRAHLKDIKINNNILKKNVDIDSIKEPTIKKNKIAYLEKFVFIQQIKPTENYSELLWCNNQLFGIMNGLNVFIGQKFIPIPREDYFLEFNRAVYYVNILINLLSLFPLPFLRLKLSLWPICFRIDDLPSNWNLLQENKLTTTPLELKQLITLCQKEGIKLNTMITPAYISKQGSIKSWFQSDFKELIEIMNDIRNYMNDNIVEIGLHGYTHVTLGKRPRYLSNRILNIVLKMIFDQKFLASEFYDRDNRKEIPYVLQENAIKKAKLLVTKHFRNAPKIFTPPQHNWDSNTEDILFNEDIPFLSCDMCFYHYPEGHECRKNPSLIGAKAYHNKNLLSISGTILAEPFPKTLELFNRLGIPFVLIRHNWEPECLNLGFLQQLIADLNCFKNKKFLKMSELGYLLLDFENSSFKTIYEINDNSISVLIELNLKTSVELNLDYRYEIIKVESTAAEKSDIIENKLILYPGNYNFRIDLKKRIL